MNAKEAVRLLKAMTSMCDFRDEYGEFDDSDPYYEAVDMAISALETQNKKHCADCQEFDCYGCEYKEHK